MGTDKLLESLSQLCSYLLPVAGVVFLIVLIFFFKNLIITLKTLNKTLDETTNMINDCNKQVNKLDKPLETINELSETVDTIHEASKSAVNTTVSIVLNNLETIRDWFANKKTKKDDAEIIVKGDESSHEC